jgi:hypothetical protein
VAGVVEATGTVDVDEASSTGEDTAAGFLLSEHYCASRLRLFTFDSSISTQNWCYLKTRLMIRFKSFGVIFWSALLMNSKSVLEVLIVNNSGASHSLSNWNKSSG